ncbi:MAG: thymidine phosphorylase [Verrucomicrobia bacterium]|nr:MAG: thymidine phosphorylase [Verrucomicrobiota bacterium]
MPALHLNFLSLIEAKRDGQVLTTKQIEDIIAAYTGGQIPDYQIAAFLMAVYFRGLNTAETRALTFSMRDSGEKLEFPSDRRPLVDKHSTGGVGDKVSLPLAPLLACLGFRVPMISGRGLGITGGTLDKLDSIPGFKTSLPSKRIIQMVQKVGCVICGQTHRMVPADKGLYALRDVTGTVPSIPLIVASILSKKLAESLSALVLDVKFGAAAFMPEPNQALALANAMVTLGNQCGVRTRALLTNMDTPLGRAAGNWLEVKEAVECLEVQSSKFKVQSSKLEDLRSIVLASAAQLLVLTRKAPNYDAGRRRAEDCLDSGAPRRKWDEMLAAQGADLSVFQRKLERDHTASVIAEIHAHRAGFLVRCDARIIGQVVRDLGGGRLSKDSVISYDVGVDRLAKPGEAIQKGAVLARVHADTRADATTACSALQSAFQISPKRPRPAPLVWRVVQ